MATSIVGRLVYLITGDSKMLNNSLASTQAAVAKFSKFVLSALGIGGAMMAFRTLIGVGKDLVEQWRAQEKAESALAAAIRTTGGDVEDLMGRYRAFASEIQRTTTIGDEQVLGLLQQARSFGISTDKMEEATRGAIGLSKAFGIDMQTALRGIANAYEGNYTALSRYIPALRNATSEAEKQTVFQKAMADGFAIAQAEAQTSTGSMLQFKNAMGDLKEEGGKVLAEFLEPSIRSLTAFIEKVTAAISEGQRLKQVAKDLSEGKKVETRDEIALLQLQVQALEIQKQMVKGYKPSEEGIQDQIDALHQQIAALAEVARYEAIGAEAKRKGDAEAAARAEAEAKRQQKLAEWIKMVNEEYGKTEQGQREILEAQIAKWEYELSRANVYKPRIQAILDKLYQQRDANLQIASSDEAMAARWVQMGITMGAIRDQELADQAEIVRRTAEEVKEKKRLWDEEAEARRIVEQALLEAAEERRRQEREAEEKLTRDKQLLQQTAINDFVSIWGELRSLNDQKAQYELDMLKRKQKAELAAFRGTEEEKQALEEQFERQRAQVEYEAALRSWKLQVAGALAALARSILEASKNAWPFPAIPMMALAAVMGGIQLAAIRAAKPVPAFAEGVDMIVPPGYPQDSFLFRAESGERLQVTPKEQVAASTAPAFPSRIILRIGSRDFDAFVEQEIDNHRILLNRGALKR